MATLKTTQTNTITLIVRVTQPENGTEFELTLDNVSEDITLSQAVGTSVQRITDYLRLYKRNASKLLDCRKDVFVSVFIETDGERVNWIAEKTMQAFKFKYRIGASEKTVKRFSQRIFDVVTFAGTPFKVVSHKDVQ